MLRDKTADNNCPYYYCDNEMFFCFNSRRSIDYNLFITNNGDLKFTNKTTNSISYETPLYQNWSYLLNASRSQKEITLNLAAEGLTSAQCEEVFEWLKAGETGLLVLDNDPFWGWNVVVSDLGDATYYKNEKGYIITFTVKFTTVGSYNKRLVYPAVGNPDEANFESSSVNELGLPQVIDYNSDESGSVFSINGNGNIWTFSLSGEINNNNAKIDSTQSISIFYEDKELIYYKWKVVSTGSLFFDFNSRTGNFIVNNNIPEDNNIISVVESRSNLFKPEKGFLPQLLDKPPTSLGDGEYIIAQKKNNDPSKYYEYAGTKYSYLYNNTIYPVIQYSGYDGDKLFLVTNTQKIKIVTKNISTFKPKIEIISYKNL